MPKRGPRPVVFVCVGIDHEKLDVVSKSIQANNQNDAANLFLEQTSIKAKNIHGPFRPKRAQVLNNTRSLKFADHSCKAVYNNWEVTAFYLKEPENHAYLVFIRRVDGQQQPQPKGPIIAPISDLRFQNE